MQSKRSYEGRRARRARISTGDKLRVKALHWIGPVEHDCVAINIDCELVERVSCTTGLDNKLFA